ncbi:MAG: alpha/beta hydrolase [Syntrophomonadaceae bacterium]|nr:alpha/beta hydrolase [Syntrophomonadaceae bacterium]MDD3022629.1 alpha/beta hydrolase [Syntrophomonadaceae bacterium]
MIRNNLNIEGIPAILWGEPSDKLFIAVHGNMSSKDDEVIVIFAEGAIDRGYQVLSFDLPEHGDRKGGYPCKVQNCVSDLTAIMKYAHTISSSISLFACSMGVYFSLLAYRDLQLEKCLFLSPVLNMERIISHMMSCSNVSEDRLKIENEIETPIGHTLYWDYYFYVKTHPIDTWDKPTAILYGSDDNISEFVVVSEFAQRYHCKLQVLEHGEHYFHTDEQLDYYKQWLEDNIFAI